MLHNSINLAVASSNKNVSISASDLDRFCITCARLDCGLIQYAPALKDDPQQQELYRIIRKDLAVSDEIFDRLVIMVRARKNTFPSAIFGARESSRADFPNVKHIRKIFDIELFRAVADVFNISYTLN